MSNSEQEVNYRQATLFPFFDGEVKHNEMLWEEMIGARLGVSYQAGWPDVFGKAIYDWATKTVTPPIKTLSLFSGGGGLDIAFHDAGFSILEMVEIDERFAATLEANSGNGKHFGNVRVICKDIRDYTPACDNVDFIIGGPPCQTFSSAGRRASGVLGTTDQRGKLFNEYVRLITQLSPKGFVFENVYGILGARGGKDWKVIKESFEHAGYHLFYRILDTADYGVPQHRERLIIVGLREGEYQFPRPTHGPDSRVGQQYYTARQAIQGIITDGNRKSLEVRGRFGYLLPEIPPGLNYSFFTEKMGHPQPIFAWRSKFSDFLYKADPDQPVRTVKASGGQYTGPFHWENRRFTADEFKRLQTFPDDYQLIGAERTAIEQIGNSVPPQFGRIIALSILEQVFSVPLPISLPSLKVNDVLGFRKRKQDKTLLYNVKAKEALAVNSCRRDNNASYEVSSLRSYFAYLSDEFGWIQTDSEEDGMGRLHVTFHPSNKVWNIFVGTTSQHDMLDSQMTIKIRPLGTAVWSLGAVEEVCLYADNLEPKIFTALWKAFEAELIRGNIKADLVQLNSYYQYHPKISMSVRFHSSLTLTEEWSVVKAVTEGRCTRKTIPSEQIARDWGIKHEKVLHYALFLRGLGFEVRNWNTNPQIPAGHFLIPYAFPTLTPLSVQLRKSLV